MIREESNNEQMEFPNTWEEFEECYGFYDTNEVYTNGSRLIPSFRVKQWLKHYKKEPCGDCISRKETLKVLMNEWTEFDSELIDYLIEKVKKLSSATSQQKIGHWEWVQYDGNPNIGNWYCSKCRTIIPHMLEETDNTPIYKWCPMCGTKMQKARIKNECL